MMIKFFCLAFLLLTGISCKTKKQAVVAVNPDRQVFIGEFMYFADAPVFRLCNNQQLYPVVMENAYIEAERQYLKQVEGGFWVYTEFTGELVVKKNEEGIAVSMLSIDKLILMDKNRQCPLHKNQE